MRYFLLITVLLWCKWPLPAQEPILYDSTRIDVRKFLPQELNAYKNDRRFQYERVSEPARSWVQRAIDWIEWQIAQLFRTKQGKYTFNAVLILLAVAIIVFFVIKLTGMSSTGLFGKKNKGEKWAYKTGEENIHAIDFEASIRQATETGNFRLAVRLLYLQVLKTLTDRKLIQWQIDKTNIAYLRELGGTAYQQHFSDLTMQFENNWYGDLPIDDKEFAIVNDQFTQFNRQLK